MSPAATQTTSLQATFSTRDQNLFNTGAAVPVGNQRVTFFDETWDEREGGSDSVDLGLLGELGGSGNISTSGRVGMSLELQGLDGGKVAVDYPVSVDVTMPAAKTFGAGDTITISTSTATVLPGAAITTVQPDLTGMAVDGTVAMQADYGFEVCVFDCFGTGGSLIDVSQTSGNLFRLSGQQLRSRYADSPAGTYCFGSAEKAILGSRPAASTTRCSDNGGYLAQPKPVVTTTTNPDGSLAATGTDTFGVIPISSMAWVQRLTGESLPLNKSISLGEGARLAWETFDVGLNTQLSRTEKLAFAPEVNVTLAFPRALAYRVVSPTENVVSSGNSASVTMPAGHKVLVDIPTDQTSAFAVTPTLSLARHDLSNEVTDTIAFAGELSAMTASLSLPGVDLGLTEIPGFSFGVGPVYTDRFDAPSTTVTAVPKTTWSLGGFNSPVLSPLQVVPAPPPVVSPVTVTPVEGAPTVLTVATFTDEVIKAVPSDYHATVDFGDGTAPITATITGSGGSYAISAPHQYEQYGTYRVTTDLRTVPSGQLATNRVVTLSSAVVSDAALSGTGITNNATSSGQKVLIWPNPSPTAPGNVVASFVDANPFGLLSDLSATIDWGDGTPITSGIVAGGVGGPFTVAGHHDYVELGLHTVTVVLKSKGGSSATTTTTTLSYANPASGTFVIGSSRATGSVTYWGSQWAKSNDLQRGGVASFKGFANQSPPACASTWRGDPSSGDSSQAPAGVPAYMAVTVTDTVSSSGNTAAGSATAVVIVRTDPGYGPTPSQTGTGEVVAVVCGQVD